MILIALDLDGTALDSNGKLTEKVMEAIRQRTECAGYRFAFCSGRPMSGVLPHAQSTGIADDYHITSNGAVIQNGRGQKLTEELLDVEVYRELTDYCRKNGLTCIAVNDCGATTAFPVINLGTLEFCFLTNNQLRVCPISELDPIDKYSKLLICDNPDIIKQNKRKIEQRFSQHYSCVQGYPTMIEFAKKNVSKGNALAELANYYGISDKQVFVVGDNGNDLSSFKRFSQSIAMGNATTELKQAARWHCPTNDEDGVVKALEIIDNFIT
ncbi:MULTISPECIES: Cof-type HAD-IIB family hydrolase [Enterococcus]|uniref:HAD family phosphatase n=1 Tax=Candidatus Enterococcus murrayae TaxID=2815321 RepID=A0ABS3HE62_9ENTE|nr:Cof-type HAD-IIB family hydrolase [Enterococcus sp. MJM16]MBO0451749.1 HAD family phosphatase [Enterococcus sp. MJM16]